MLVLQVIDQAFRTVVEEQDDTILWLSQSMRGAGAELKILLSGHAVYYAVQSKRQPALRLGAWKQEQPANIRKDLARLGEKGVPVYAVREDINDRGLTDVSVNSNVQLISRSEIVDLYNEADQIWHW